MRLLACAVQEYLALQEELAGAMRGGFLSLAQARYSMGADRVSVLQFPSQMQPAARLRVAGAVPAPHSLSPSFLLPHALCLTTPARCAAEDGALELVVADSNHSTGPSSSPGGAAAPPSRGSSGSSWTAASPPHPASHAPCLETSNKAASCSSGGADAESAVPSSSCTASGGAPAAAEVAETMQRLRLAAQESGSIMDQLAAKYCSGSGEAGGEPGRWAETRLGGWGSCMLELCANCSPNAACRHITALFSDTLPPASHPASSTAHPPCSTDKTAAEAGPAGGELDDFAEVARPGRPLHWFGSLVAPSLRDAEGHFGRALELAVQAANAQARLRRSAESYRSATAEQG